MENGDTCLIEDFLPTQTQSGPQDQDSVFGSKVYTYNYPHLTENSPSLGLQRSTDAHGNQLAFDIASEHRLVRFLVLGSEGTFYATERELTEQNTSCVQDLIKAGHGLMVVEKVIEVAQKGRTIRKNAVLLTLALCCRSEDARVRSSAHRAILDVCTIPTHLFKFVTFLENNGKTTGWGRGLRKAVSLWYNQFSFTPRRLAMLVTKYRQRDGWSHRDLLRLCHLKPANEVVGYILRYMVRGQQEAKKYYVEDGKADCTQPQMKEIIAYLNAVEEVRNLETGVPQPKLGKRRRLGSDDEMDSVITEGKEGSEEGQEKKKEMEVDDGVLEGNKLKIEAAIQRCVELIVEFDLLREHVQPGLLNFSKVWEALLQKMPMMAMIRNLPKMSYLGLFEEPQNRDLVIDRLSTAEAIRGSKVHPYAILLAWYTYNRGQGLKGHLQWTPLPEVTAALEKAFYAAFGNVPATNKRILIALDVSGSMNCTQNGEMGGITPRIGCAAMAMVTMAVESHVDIVGFSDNLRELEIKKEWTLEEVMHYIASIPMGGTDCSLPMLWALENRKAYDAFIIYTDNETWFSRIRPADALVQYRKEMNIPTARLAVVGMTSGGFTLADPADLYMLDIVGFDVDAPLALQEFIAGTIFE